MTAEIRAQIMEKAIEYGTGRDTLRCLALATADTPMDPSDMDLNESSKFAKYEVCANSPSPPPGTLVFRPGLFNCSVHHGRMVFRRWKIT